MSQSQETVKLTNDMHYCSGCTHRIVHAQLVSVIDQLGIAGDTIGVAPVGCASYLMKYFDIDVVGGPHGRAPAIATAIKRLTKKFVFTYQGDGDLAAIGTAEIFQAAVRAENISVIYVNNATYGMTAGQSSPTTLIGQITKSAKQGRRVEEDGYPFDITRLLAQMPGVGFAARAACDTPENTLNTRTLIERAFRHQLEGRGGLAIVEVLAICPPALGLNVPESSRWLHYDLRPEFPLGVMREAPCDRN